MSVPACITLRKNLARRLRAGHPWIFRDALEPGSPIEDGALVRVCDPGGRSLVVGFWDSRSAIAVRVIGPSSLEDPRPVLAARLRKALELRQDRLDRARTDAFRWVHGEADGLPGIHIDLYDEVAVVRFDGQGARAFYADLGAALALAARPLELREVIDRETGARLHGRGAPATFLVRENGLRFEVAPRAGGKGGLFLDQRENREQVERCSEGRSVLNLFGYTGAFSLYAARGGARSTDTVDQARAALRAARRNFELNRLPVENAGFHEADVFEFLKDAVARGRSWNLVISDPPSFAPNQSSRENARRAYLRLHRLACRATLPGGWLCAASCSSHFGRKEFLETLSEGAAREGRKFELVRCRGAGFDHPVLESFPEGDYLKFAMGRVR